MRRLLVILLAWSLTTLTMALPAAAGELEAFAEGRQIMLLRHAHAPGSGDPADFEIDDCSKQRNLGDGGRAQAKRFGAYLRAIGIGYARVYSSEWCRCQETAELLGLGDVETFTGLNSFYTVPERREEWLQELRAFLALLGRRTDEPVVLVTHYVTINAIAGVGVGSGEAVLLDLHGYGQQPTFAEKLVIP